MASFSCAARRVRDDPAAVLDPQCIRSACVAAGHRYRERVLDPVLTVTVMALQVLYGNCPIAQLVRIMHGLFSESAFCQARERLPIGVLTDLLSRLTESVRTAIHRDDAPGLWHGRRTLLIDGTGFSMPDTPQLAARFGYPANTQAGCGFPVAHLLAVFDAFTGLILSAVCSSWYTSDHKLAPYAHDRLERGDILIGDRSFGSFAHVAVLLALGVDCVCRHSSTRDRARPRRTRTRCRRHGLRRQTVLVKRLGEGDELVEWVRRDDGRGVVWMSLERYRALPRTLIVRTIRYRTQRPGWRTGEVILATTLLDPILYPASEITELYGLRWGIELAFRSLKRTMGLNVLRCKSVDGVLKELTMFCLVYNLVRLVMLKAALAQRVHPSRISFADALRFLSCATPGEDLPRLKVNPLRPSRWDVRLIKRRPSRTYPLLTMARADAKDYLLRHGKWVI